MTDLNDTPPNDESQIEQPKSSCEINGVCTVRKYPDGSESHLTHASAEEAEAYKASVDALEGEANG